MWMFREWIGKRTYTVLLLYSAGTTCVASGAVTVVVVAVVVVGKKAKMAVGSAIYEINSLISKLYTIHYLARNIGRSSRETSS